VCRSKIVLGFVALRAAPLAPTHGKGHDQHHEHDRYGNHDHNDPCRYGRHGDKQSVAHFVLL